MKKLLAYFLIATQLAYAGIVIPGGGGSSGGGGSGVDTVGAFSASAQTNGASISSTTMTFGPASATVPGMVGTGTQSWAGTKNFTGVVGVADGSVGTPALGFTTDSGASGLYRISANRTGFSCNGVSCGDFGASGNWGFGTGSGTNSIITAGGSLLATTSQRGLTLTPTFTSAATAGGSGIAMSLATAAASFTQGIMQAISIGTMIKGAGSTITRAVNITGGVQSVGTNNAFLTDNNTWTGNYFINQAGTEASLFSGPVTLANVIDSGLTASTVPYADSSKQLTSSTVTPTELGYVHNVTSAIQTQMDLKAPLASPTFTGTVKGIDIGTTANGGDGKIITIGSGRISTGDSAANAMQFTMVSGGTQVILENGQQVLTASAQSANWGAFAASRDWTMQWQMGKGTSHYGKGKVRGYGSSTAVGNPADATEDDLISKTVQANELPNNDEDLTITSWGTTGATANTKTIKLYFGGTAIGTISTIGLSKTWKIDSIVSRTGSSAEKYVTTMNIDGLISITSGTLAVSTTGTIVVKTTGQSSGSGASDVLNEALRVDYDRAGN